MKFFVGSITLISVLFAGWIVFDTLQIVRDMKPLPCDQLPTIEEVENVFAEQQEQIKRIEGQCVYGQIFPAHRVGGNPEKCPGKSDIIIQYATVTDRSCFKKALGDTFFGLPYRMQNM